MRRVCVAGLALLFAVASAAAEPLPADDDACQVPAELRGLQANLPHTAAAVRAMGELIVVALGSSSTVGVGASRPEKAYPAQLADVLQRAWPDLAITVRNAGIGGETTDQMLGRLDGDVLVHQPHLVIWQMGSNGQTEDRDIAAHGEFLRRGIARMTAAGADIVLMDLQYAPRLLRKARFKDIVDGIAAVAAETQVGLLRRFEIMRYWVQGGRFALGELIVSDQLHMSDVGYTCIARILAEGIVRATAVADDLAITAP